MADTKDFTQQDEPDPAEYGQLASIGELLETLNLDRRIMADLQAVIAGVKAHGGKGSLTFKLTIEDDDPALRFTPSISTTVPKQKLSGRLLHADRDNYPAIDDPHKRRLPFPTPIKDRA